MLRRLFSRRKTTPVSKWDLSQPLVAWSDSDVWKLRDALEGCLILGRSGSGKTSGSGRLIACAMMSAGFGGLVLTAKPDERALFESYARRTGRSDDLIVFGPGQPYVFNFLQDAVRNRQTGVLLTETILNLLCTVLEVAERNGSGGGGREDEGYWRRAVRQLIRNVIDLLRLADMPITVWNIYRAVISAPTSEAQSKSAQWKESSFCYQCLLAAEKVARSPIEIADLDLVAAYVLREFAELSDKTRSVIVSTFTSMIDVLQRGIMRELFGGETNIGPEILECGKIIVIDLPVMVHGEAGVFAQVLWKYATQKYLERRPVTENTRPVFLWSDEAQHFCTIGDALFQTTCRSARVATVLLSQSIGNFEVALGGEKAGHAQAAALFGNLNTKIFHANGDPETNEWASTLVGRTRQAFTNASNSHGPDDWLSSMAGMRGTGQTSSGFSEAYEFEVQPTVFTELRTGGPENTCEVDGIVVQSGRRFQSTGRTWLPVTFKQDGRR